MAVIGLTGGIASGKSTISKMLKELGAAIIDADIIARKVVRKGEKAYNNIVEQFGEKILLPNGELDRKALGGIVFSDKDKLRLLNGITHPYIIEEIEHEIEKLKQQDIKVIVLDAAILIELGLQNMVDEVWLVAVSLETQIKRLMDRDKLSYDDAMNRINSQCTNKEKQKYADVILDNERPISEITEEVKELYYAIVGENNCWLEKEAPVD